MTMGDLARVPLLAPVYPVVVCRENDKHSRSRRGPAVETKTLQWWERCWEERSSERRRRRRWPPREQEQERRRAFWLSGGEPKRRLGAGRAASRTANSFPSSTSSHPMPILVRRVLNAEANQNGADGV